MVAAEAGGSIESLESRLRRQAEMTPRQVSCFSWHSEVVHLPRVKWRHLYGPNTLRNNTGDSR